MPAKSNALLKAVKAKKYGAVKALLAMGKSASAADEGGSALHYAVQNNDTATLALLLQNDADITKINKDYTAIESASALQLWNCVEVFAENRRESDGKANYGSVLLDVLTDRLLTNSEKYRIAKLLVESGAELNWHITRKNDPDEGKNALHLAVQNSDPATLALLLEHGADISSKGNKKCLTPIGLAAKLGHVECIKTFLKYKKSNQKLECYVDALLRAANANHIQIVSLLLSAGTSQDSRFVDSKNNALHCAVLNRNPAMVALLSKYSSKEDNEVENSDEFTPIDLAAEIRDWDCIDAFPKNDKIHNMYCEIAKESRIIQHDLLRAKKENPAFAKIPNEIMESILSYVPYLPKTVKEFDTSEKALLLSSAQTFCSKYKEFRFFSIKSKESKDFQKQLEGIIKQDESIENKFQKASDAIGKFALSKGEQKSRAMSLLARYHLFSQNDSRQTITTNEVDKNNVTSQGEILSQKIAV